MNGFVDLKNGYSWSDRFCIGLPEVDQQHHQMTELVSQLAQLANTDAPNPKLLEVVRELLETTTTHFAYEEALMQQYQLTPDFTTAHQNAHASLIEQIRIVVNMLETAIAPSAKTVAKLLPFLHKWLIFHVVGTDMRMSRMITALQRGMEPEVAAREGVAQQTDSLVVLLDALNDLYDDLSARSAELQEAHHQLSLSEARYALAQRAARIGSWDYDLRSATLNWSKEVEILFGGLPATQSSGREAYLRHVHPDDMARVEQAVNTTLQELRPYDIEHRIIRVDGVVRWVAATGDFVCAADGSAQRLVGIVRDITDSKEAQHRLEETNQQLTLALDSLERHATDLTRLNMLNEGLQSSLTVHDAYEVLERTLAQLQLGSGGSLALASDQGRSMRTVASWGDGAGMLNCFNTHDCWAMRRGQRHALQRPDTGPQCKHFISPPNGAILCQPLQVLGETLGLLTIKAPAAINDTDWARVNHLASMVSESLKLALSNIRLREALHEQAIRDPLTHLLNRRYLDETLPRELHRAAREHRKLSVVILDLDHFKHVNDTWGHEAGDVVLAHVAKLVSIHLRASDLACRFGGEEFVVVMLGADLNEAQERMENIAAQVRASHPKMHDQDLPAVSFSAGIAEAFVHGDTADKLLRVADHALYAAKAAGRNRIFVAPIPA